MNTNIIKAVFFDYDGVLTLDRTGSLSICKYLSSITGIKLDAVLEVYRLFNHDLLLGVKTHAHIWDELCVLLNVNITEDQLLESFKSTPINTKMIELAITLKSNGLLLGIITDNKMDRMNCLREYQNLDSLFDTIVVSSEVGFDKKSSEIFNKALGNLNVDPHLCAFIDNNEHNLVIPREMGMTTILHDDAANDVESIRLQLRI